MQEFPVKNRCPARTLLTVTTDEHADEMLVIDQTTANELAKAKRSYGPSHLTLGMLHAEAGLLREAEHEFRLRQKANPQSEIVKKR